MLRLEPITTLDLPELAPYRTMKWQHEHRQKGIFIAEGDKVVHRLLESDLPILSLLLPDKWVDHYRPVLEKRREEVVVYTAPKSLLETMTGYVMYQGVLALAKVPASVSLDSLLHSRNRPLLLLALDGLANAENMGGIVRNAAAFGAHALIVGETSCSPYLRRAVRSSMGTIFKMPVVETTSLERSLRYLESCGVTCVAAHPHTNEKVLSSVDFRSDVCVVLGSEGAGLSPAVLDACREKVVVPMQNQVDSLNVGDASAVFLYEAARQRGQS